MQLRFVLDLQKLNWTSSATEASIGCYDTTQKFEVVQLNIHDHRYLCIIAYPVLCMLAQKHPGRKRGGKHYGRNTEAAKESREVAETEIRILTEVC